MKKALMVVGFLGVFLSGCVGGSSDTTSASEQCTQSGNVWNSIENKCSYCPDGVWQGSSCIAIPTFIQSQLTLSISENNQIIDELLFQGIGEGKMITYTFTNSYNESYYTPELRVDNSYLEYVTNNNITGYSDQFAPTQYLNNGASDNCINKTILLAGESCSYQVFYYVPGTYTLNGLSQNQKTFTPYSYYVVKADKPKVPLPPPSPYFRLPSGGFYVDRCFLDPRTNQMNCPESWATQLESLGLYSQIKNIPTGTYTTNSYSGNAAYSANGQYMWKCSVDGNGDLICNRFDMTYDRNSNTLVEGNTIESSVNFGVGAANNANSLSMRPVNDGTLWISYTTSTTINRAVISSVYGYVGTFDDLNTVVGEDNSFWANNARYNPSTSRFEQSNISDARQVFNNGIVLSYDYLNKSLDNVTCWTYKESGTDWSGTTLVYESAPVEVVDEPYVFDPNANYEYSLLALSSPLTLYTYQFGEFQHDDYGSMVNFSYKVTLHNGRCRVNHNQFGVSLARPTAQWYLASPYVAYPSTIYGLQ